MDRSRAVLARFPGLAALLLVLALAMKAWVPIGYMPVFADGRLLLAPCSGFGVMEMPMAGMQHAMHAGMNMTGDMTGENSGTAGHVDSGQMQMVCTFSALAAPALAGADPLLLAALVVFLFVAALRLHERPSASRAVRLRPPAQGPPAFK